MTDFIAIPAIPVLCYLFAEGYKIITTQEKWKHIPVLCGACGGVLGVLCYLFIAGYIPAENVLVAAAIGVVSGWAATGANQSWKQETEEDAA